MNIFDIFRSKNNDIKINPGDDINKLNEAILKLKNLIDEKANNTEINIDKKISLINVHIEETKSFIVTECSNIVQSKLLDILKGEINNFEINTNNKISGMLAYVNDKIPNINNKPTDVSLLKKIAKLDGLRERIIKERDLLRSSGDIKSSDILDRIIKGDSDV